MAQTSALFDGWGVIYDAAKRLPSEDLKLAFIAALAERLTQVRRNSIATSQCSPPTGVESDTNYTCPSPTIVTSYQDLNSCGDEAMQSQLSYDGFGRLAHSIEYIPRGQIYVDHAYDGLDRPYSVSNPYQQGVETPHYTTFSPYDSLGRILRSPRLLGTPKWPSSRWWRATTHWNCQGHMALTERQRHKRGTGRIRTDRPPQFGPVVGICTAPNRRL